MTTVTTILTSMTTPNGTIRPTGHTLSEPFAYFAATCFILIILTSVLCNMVLISTIVSTRKLHSVTHVFIVNLAISDLITVLGTVPFDVEFMLRGYFPNGQISCGIMQITFLISLPSSVLNLTLLTAERFISVVFPFKRRFYLTKLNVIMAVVTTWSYTFLVAFFPIILNRNAVTVSNGVCFLAYPIAYDIFQLIANFLLPIFFICFANVMLFCVSCRHAKHIRKHSCVQGTFQSFIPQEEVFRSALLKKKTRKSSIFGRKKQPLSKVHKNLKAAKRIALLVGVFLFCWLTYIILVAWNISCNVCHPRELTWFGNIINYSSSAVNPLLYGWLNGAIRKEVVKKARYLFCNRFSSCQKDNIRNRASTTTSNLPVENLNNNDI